MASIAHDPGGRKRILFTGADGIRKAIRLGKMPQKATESIRYRVEQLNAAAIARQPVDDDTARWVADLESVLADKLAAVGLIPKRHKAKLQDFIESYVTSRADVKPATKEIWGQGKRGLIEFFGANKPVREITAGDADNYKMHLVAQKLASMTVRKRLQFAKMIFRAMVKHRIISSNPFDAVSTQATMIPGRQQFITQEQTGKLLERCPDSTWRAIIALSRYGGLRCPSEVLSLRWQDIDWENGKIRITSPKTAHHPGKDFRIIPLFPELLPILMDASETAPEGSIYVAEKYREAAMGPHGWRNINLRTRFLDIISAAGLKEWPKLFHNLRSSRETELCERFPLHVVSGWLGNTPTIAIRHYLQTTEQHFQDATKPVDKVAQIRRSVCPDCFVRLRVKK